MIEVIPRKNHALRRVLFLCGENHHEGRFCEELLNSHARTEGLNWQAISRAVVSQPAARNEGPISAGAVAYLRLLGAAPVNHLRLPLQASEFDFRMSSTVIALDRVWEPQIKRCWPCWAAQVRYWRTPGLGERGSQAALAHLAGEVRALCSALQCRDRGSARQMNAPTTAVAALAPPRKKRPGLVRARAERHSGDSQR